MAPNLSGSPAGPAAAEPHARPGLLSDFILGSQDGLVNVLGILLGLLAAHVPSSTIVVAALAALAAESISMGAVAYTSTLARHRFYLGELERERREMRELPEEERQEVREILSQWGYEGEEREEMLRRIEAKPAAMLDLMMAFELRLAPVGSEAAGRSALVVGLATIFGSVIPLLPLLVSSDPQTVGLSSVLLSGITLFGVGVYEARTTLGSIWRSGLRMLLIGLAAGFGGFLVGHLLGMVPNL